MPGIVTMAGPGSRHYAAASGGTPDIFFDDFNYTVSRVQSSATKLSTFQAAGYTSYKDENESAGANGYLYTVDTIEGYAGTIPGASGKALCLEAVPVAQGAQSDYYLQLGSGTAGDIPANIWIQFWVYLQRDAGSSKVSSSPSGKLFYPLFGDRTDYPEDPLDVAWLTTVAENAYQTDGSYDVTPPETGAFTFNIEANPTVDPPSSALAAERRAYIPAQQAASQNYFRMTPMVDSGNTHILPNTWFLVKMHHDVLNNPGKLEVWWREKDSPTFIKTMDFVHGSTPDAGFTYNTFTEDNLGAKLLRFPTTANTDYWMYFADLAMASSDSNLPTYGY